MRHARGISRVSEFMIETSETVAGSGGVASFAWSAHGSLQIADPIGAVAFQLRSGWASGWWKPRTWPTSWATAASKS